MSEFDSYHAHGDYAIVRWGRRWHCMNIRDHAEGGYLNSGIIGPAHDSLAVAFAYLQWRVS